MINREERGVLLHGAFHNETNTTEMKYTSGNCPVYSNLEYQAMERPFPSSLLSVSPSSAFPRPTLRASRQRAYRSYWRGSTDYLLNHAQP